jgi:ubiquinone/menaquinone biosynthesis C-methylase UbiE
LTELPDYRDDADAYELEEHARPDEMAMLTTVGNWASTFLNKADRARVLDLCCGTGLSMESLVDHRNVSIVVGVDISEPYLAFAKRKYLSASLPPLLIHGDAVSCAVPFDDFHVIMMASAYHHIDDARKIAFLTRVRVLLGRTGHGFIAENILPPYKTDDRQSYAEAVSSFYRKVYECAVRADPSLDKYAADLIKRVAQYGYDGDYEYKVCWSVFERDLTASGLTIVQSEKVWPVGESPLGTGGNYVLEVRAE